ncbi:hypothetical protein FRC01_005306 [Tulasnella sp. 417]|nr:hypothetical protein FRC01_005306 [Tulasnella sp. 417]
MAPVTDQLDAATDLARRNNNDGIDLVDYKIKHDNPTIIWFKWSHKKNSPDKFSIYLRRVKTGKYYLARGTEWTVAEQAQIVLNSIKIQPGECQLILTKFPRHKEVVYARSNKFYISKSDLS